MTESVKRASNLLGYSHIIFFEVWVEDHEDITEVANALTALNCTAFIDGPRRVVRTFRPHSMPRRLANG